uniref:FIIND domain-containing protein n=1 Tax=Oncorhynchus tshawytscha TaxID=74940 RepID=A0AAZ3RWW5_ONCTS
MVKSYGPERAVRITLKILRRINLDDLAEKLERDHTGVLLLTSLQELTEDQLKKFQSCGRIFGFPPIPKSQLENTDRQDTVDQMVKRYGLEGAVRNTWRILWRMNLDDLAEKLQRDHTRATTWRRDSSDSDKWRRRKEGLVMRRPSMTHPVPALLLTTLEELTEEQLKTFQSHLTIGRMLDFPPIPERQLENTDRQNTVDQMVKRYGPEGAVRNIWRILRRMNLDDLAEKLERDHTREPNDPILGQALPISPSPVSRSPSCSSSDTVPSEEEREHVLPAQRVVADTEMEELNCKETTPTVQSAEDPVSNSLTPTVQSAEDPVSNSLTPTVQSAEDPGPSYSYNVLNLTSSWQPSLELCNEFTPNILDHEGNGTYRFQCPSAGLFQCSITGLVFRMEGEAEVLYRTVHWDRRLLSQRGKRPAGPLFMFTCLKGSVCQLHLPHCEIHSEGGCDFLSVAHVTDDDSMEFLHHHETTESHVILNITGFSKYGITKDKEAPVSPIRALVLLFYKLPDDKNSSTLNVLLLPRNVDIDEVCKTRRTRNGDREIYIEVNPNCRLIPDQEYTLSTDLTDEHHIDPKEAEFVDYDSYTNYMPTFQLRLKTVVEEVNLLLEEHGGPENERVWNRLVSLPAPVQVQPHGPVTPVPAAPVRVQPHGPVTPVPAAPVQFQPHGPVIPVPAAPVRVQPHRPAAPTAAVRPSVREDQPDLR